MTAYIGNLKLLALADTALSRNVQEGRYLGCVRPTTGVGLKFSW